MGQGLEEEQIVAEFVKDGSAVVAAIDGVVNQSMLNLTRLEAIR